jgi:hypothetical protein
MIDLVARKILLVTHCEVNLTHLEDVLNLIFQKVCWQVDEDLEFRVRGRVVKLDNQGLEP